ncbi:hypothetical protein HD806DRAFT_521223 [Xylariaceae sp. AK1471]|nr:hypothetical protein HD806DRAFT_521223 [Xylariaceae sp. AK1471]
MAEAEADNKHSTFPLFSSLPPELRNQVWHNSLPGVSRALYFYRKECWQPRLLSIFDEDFDPENAENNLIVELNHDLLDYVRIEVPLAFVNIESRGIALTWADEHGLEIRTCPDTHELVFLRAFDPSRDALYVAPSHWDEFIDDAVDLIYKSDLFVQHVDIRPGFTRIAVSESTIRSSASEFSDDLYLYDDIRTLYIVVDTPADLGLQFGDSNPIIQPRWKVESLHKVHGLVQKRIGYFEVRPVLAVRK